MCLCAFWCKSHFNPARFMGSHTFFNRKYQTITRKFSSTQNPGDPTSLEQLQTLILRRGGGVQILTWGVFDPQVLNKLIDSLHTLMWTHQHTHWRTQKIIRALQMNVCMKSRAHGSRSRKMTETERDRERMEERVNNI